MATLNLVTNVVVRGEQGLKNLNRDLGKVDDNAKKVGGRFGGLGAAVGSFITPTTAAIGAVAGLTVALAGAASAALDEEKGIAALTASLKANDPASVGQIDRIEETIRARENLAFADDEQRESLARLVGVTKNVNKALDLQRTAMDLARLRGIDLATASDLVGKVYGGNVGILARYGIQLRKGVTATEALAEIQKRSAGQAEAFADTTTGAVESLGVVFDDLVEDIGKALLPVLKDVALFLRDDFIPFLRDIAPIVGGIGSAIGSVAGVINEFVNPFGAALDRQKKELEQHQKDEAKRLKAGEDAWLGYQTTILNASDDVVDTVRALTEAELGAIEDHWDEIRAAGSETVAQYNVGIFEAQTSLQTEIDALLKVLDERLAPAEEIAYLRGKKAALLLARGAADAADDGPAVAAINSMIAKINAQLNALSGYDAGKKFTSSFAAGLVDPVVISFVRQSAYRVALAARGIFPSSEPKDPRSPFRGITDAFGFMDVFAAGLLKNDDVVPTALRNAFNVPGLSTALSVTGAGATTGPGGAGTTTVINNWYLRWDGEPPKGRNEAEVIAVLDRLTGLVDNMTVPS